jgi:hypothetical protein
VKKVVAVGSIVHDGSGTRGIVTKIEGPFHYVMWHVPEAKDENRKKYIDSNEEESSQP